MTQQTFVHKIFVFPFYVKYFSTYKTSRTNTKKDVLFTIGDWNVKAGSQEICGVTDKFGLGEENETGQRLTEFCQEKALVIANILFQEMTLYMDITGWSILKSD